MNSHQCAIPVRLLSDSTGEVERLIERWVFNKGHFEPPIRISASVLTNSDTITALSVRWVWDYDRATSMKRTITIGLAISLNIRLHNLSKPLGFKWNPSTSIEVYNTFTCLLKLIPSLNQYIIIEKR